MSIPILRSTIIPILSVCFIAVPLSSPARFLQPIEVVNGASAVSFCRRLPASPSCLLWPGETPPAAPVIVECFASSVYRVGNQAKKLSVYLCRLTSGSGPLNAFRIWAKNSSWGNPFSVLIRC